MFQPESTYHIYNRANGNENLFREKKNYYFFIEKYYYYLEPIADTLAWCLLANHFHAMIKIKKENVIKRLEGFKEFKNKTSAKLQALATVSDDELVISNFISRQFGNLFSSYAQAYNKVYTRRGSLFQPNMKKKLVTKDSYFTQLILYIHNNSVKHGFVKNLYDWPYSSVHVYNHEFSKSSKLLESLSPNLLRKMNNTKQDVLYWFGGQKQFNMAHINITDIQSVFD